LKKGAEALGDGGPDAGDEGQAEPAIAQRRAQAGEDLLDEAGLRAGAADGEGNPGRTVVGGERPAAALALPAAPAEERARGIQTDQARGQVAVQRAEVATDELAREREAGELDRVGHDAVGSKAPDDAPAGGEVADPAPLRIERHPDPVDVAVGHDAADRAAP